jgi:hypothetical protein
MLTTGNLWTKAGSAKFSHSLNYVDLSGLALGKQKQELHRSSGSKKTRAHLGRHFAEFGPLFTSGERVGRVSLNRSADFGSNCPHNSDETALDNQSGAECEKVATFYCRFTSCRPKKCRKKYLRWPWRRGIVVIASANRTEAPRVRIPPGCKVARKLYKLQCCCYT